MKYYQHWYFKGHTIGIQMRIFVKSGITELNNLKIWESLIKIFHNWENKNNENSIPE
jgi:hypothetical protein